MNVYCSIAPNDIQCIRGTAAAVLWLCVAHLTPIFFVFSFLRICLTIFLNEFHCIFSQSRVFRFHFVNAPMDTCSTFERASSLNISTSWTHFFFLLSLAVQFVRRNSSVFFFFCVKCSLSLVCHCIALCYTHSIHNISVFSVVQCNQCQQIELRNAMCTRIQRSNVTFVRYFGIILCFVNKKKRPTMMSKNLSCTQSNWAAHVNREWKSIVISCQIEQE